MTPAQVYRAALCLADRFDTVADEIGREDAHAGIIGAHADAAVDLARNLDGTHSGNAGSLCAWPENATPTEIIIVLESARGPTIADLTRWADAWRSWGEARRAELAACPVCEEAKAEAPGPMCADMHVDAATAPTACPFCKSTMGAGNYHGMLYARCASEACGLRLVLANSEWKPDPNTGSETARIWASNPHLHGGTP